MTEKSVAIYKIVNALNGRMYIGQTVSPKKRALRHFWKNNGCVKLKNAITKYGKDSFVFSVLFWCENKADANEAETLLIEMADSRENGYNVTPGGDGTGSGPANPFYGKKHTPAVVEAIKAINTGRKPTPEQREKMIVALKKRTMTEATKEKLRARPVSALCSERTAEANRKRVWTHESREKLAEKVRGTKMSEDARHKIAAANSLRVWSEASRKKTSDARRRQSEKGSTA